MRKLSLAICIILFVFSACSDKKKIPKGILPREKMQMVMWDMIRAEEFLDGFVFAKDTSIDKAAESLKWYDKIYQVYGITKDEFVRSYTYYKEHPAFMKEILDSLSKKDMSKQDPADQHQPSPLPLDTQSTQKILLPEKDTLKLMIDSVKKSKNLNRIKVQ